MTAPRRSACRPAAAIGHTQAIVAFDVALHELTARRAGSPLAKLPASQRARVPYCCPSGGLLHAPIGPLEGNASASTERGTGGIKPKAGKTTAD